MRHSRLPLTLKSFLRRCTSIRRRVTEERRFLEARTWYSGESGKAVTMSVTGAGAGLSAGACSGAGADAGAGENTGAV